MIHVVCKQNEPHLHCRAQNMIASRFLSYFGPLESSQSPSSCSIFFPLLSGFYRVVNHICRWSQTQLVAVFIGSSKILKSRNNQLKLKFQRSQKISLAINSWIGLNILVFSKSLFPQKLKNNGYSNKNSSLVQKKGLMNILDISCWPNSKIFQHFSDFQYLTLSNKNSHKLGLPPPTDMVHHSIES